MCRMLGVVSRGPVPYDLFEEFADLAATGACPSGPPDERGHRDGWGLVAFLNGALLVDARGAGGAPDDPRFFQAAWKVARINPERREGSLLAVLAHVRRASPGGNAGVENTHPRLREALGRRWAFAHNGTLKGFDYGREGSLDSDAYFASVLGGVDRGVFEAYRGASAEMHRRYRPTSLTSLLTDGRGIHALRLCNGSPEYYTLHQDHWGEAVVLCSEPLPLMKANPVGNGQMLSVGPDLRVETASLV